MPGSCTLSPVGAGGSPSWSCAWEPLSTCEALAPGAPFRPLGLCWWLLVASLGS